MIHGPSRTGAVTIDGCREKSSAAIWSASELNVVDCVVEELRTCRCGGGDCSIDECCCLLSSY